MLLCKGKQYTMDKSNNTYCSTMQLKCEPIECVRIGFVGLGVRAKRAVHRMMHIEGCKIVALCDLVEENITEATAIITGFGHPSPVAFTGNDGWKQLCELADVDLV